VKDISILVKIPLDFLSNLLYSLKMLYFLIFVATYIVIRLLTTDKTVVKPTTCLKLHSWIYKDDGNEGEYMICSVCNKTPDQAVASVKGVEI
jgi:hypothetical protein